MKGIIPHSKAKGTDFCADDKYHYIIRSDLGCYMRTKDIKQGLDISIFSLHPACQNGDHYLYGDGSFVIIKGDSFRRVKNLTTDSDAQVYKLHPNFQGGDHYFSSTTFRVVFVYFIIFQEKGTIRITGNLQEDKSGEEHKLDPIYRSGLYYWSLQDHCFFLMPVSDWGVQFCEDNNTDQPFVYSVHPDVLNFLPGGLSVTQGPASGSWEIIKSITNDSTTPVTWQKKINKKVGYNKEKMSQITHNWKIDMSSSLKSGGLAGLIAKCQFSFSAEYGGSHVSTDTESWNEATEVEEQLTFELKPNQSLYLWQYKLSLGEDPVLFCRDLKISNKPNPPTEDPLSATQ